MSKQIVYCPPESGIPHAGAITQGLIDQPGSVGLDTGDPIMELRLDMSQAFPLMA